jgi:hypothetical protein
MNSIPPASDLSRQDLAGSGPSGTGPQAASLSEGARLVNTFVAPSKTFTDIRRNASWWGPFILLAIFSIGFVYTVGQKVGFYQVVQNQAQMSEKVSRQLDSMPPAQREANMNLRAKITRSISYGFPVLMLIWYAIVALVLFGTFKLGAGADLSFKATFAVVLYSSLPQIIKTLLSMVSLFAGADPTSFSMQNPVATNPGYFLDPRSSHFLYTIATSLDIFMIWTLVLTAIGLTCVSKLKRSTALFGVFGWFILLTLVGAALSGVFS